LDIGFSFKIFWWKVWELLIVVVVKFIKTFIFFIVKLLEGFVIELLWCLCFDLQDLNFIICLIFVILILFFFNIFQVKFRNIILNFFFRIFYFILVFRGFTLWNYYLGIIISFWIILRTWFFNYLVCDSLTIRWIFTLVKIFALIFWSAGIILPQAEILMASFSTIKSKLILISSRSINKYQRFLFLLILYEFFIPIDELKILLIDNIIFSFNV